MQTMVWRSVRLHGDLVQLLMGAIRGRVIRQSNLVIGICQAIVQLGVIVVHMPQCVSIYKGEKQL